jgi:hypothetical protein
MQIFKLETFPRNSLGNKSIDRKDIKKVGVDIDKDRRPVIGRRQLLGSSAGGRFPAATQAPSLDSDKKFFVEKSGHE